MMGEQMWVDGAPFKAIYDPLEVGKVRKGGGMDTDGATTVFIERHIIMSLKINDGSILSFSHQGGQVRLRVESIEDDGSNILEVRVGPRLKGSLSL